MTLKEQFGVKRANIDSKSHKGEMVLGWHKTSPSSQVSLLITYSFLVDSLGINKQYIKEPNQVIDCSNSV
jgi:hypothetical protein